MRSEFIPTFPSHPGTTKVIPWIILLGDYISSIRLQIIMIREYLIAVHGELLRNLSSQQAAIHPTLAEPPPCVRWKTGREYLSTAKTEPARLLHHLPGVAPAYVSLAPSASVSASIKWGNGGLSLRSVWLSLVKRQHPANAMSSERYSF